MCVRFYLSREIKGEAALYAILRFRQRAIDFNAILRQLRGERVVSPQASDTSKR